MKQKLGSVSRQGLVLRAACCAAILIFAVSCGTPMAPGSQSGTTVQPGSGPPLPINWETPFYHGKVLSSVAQAKTYVNFTVRVPSYGVAPKLIEVEDPAGVEIGDRSLVLVYELDPYGIVWVTEDNRDQALRTEADFQRWADAPPPGSSPGEFRVVEVRSTKGLLQSGRKDNPNAASLVFIEQGVHITIMGPTLTQSDVIELANKL